MSISSIFLFTDVFATPVFTWTDCTPHNTGVSKYDGCLKIYFDENIMDVALMVGKRIKVFTGHLLNDTDARIVATGARPFTDDEIYVSFISLFISTF